MIPRFNHCCLESVKKWWLWGFCTVPVMYAQTAILVNEFTGHKWSHVSSNTNVSVGVEILKSRGFFTEAYWYWIGLGALFGMMLVYNFCYVLALTFLDPLGKPQPLLSEDGNEDNERPNQNRNKRLVLPFEPHTITFDEIKYSVDMPQEMKDHGANEDRLVLLKGVSGAFRPGVLTALKGVSGAGKTTLMDVLAGRKTGGYIEGSITISGYPKKQETFARICGYCEQTDIHSPYVTVYESLLFSAWLRLPQDVDSETRKILVEVVMDLVELTPLRGGLVGLPGVSGLSAEQRKRLAIAVELVANPSIIFMDEPTSGLDARAAAIVMRAVRNTVDTGRTVLFLMKRGGQEIYVGPLGQQSSHMINYFEAIEGVPRIRNGQNPATWMLEVTSSAQETILGIDFADLYRSSDLYRKNKALIDELSNPRAGTKDLHFPTKYSQPSSTQFMACLWKQHWSYWRNPPYTAVRIVFTFFMSCALGLHILGHWTTESDVFNAMGSMYCAIFLFSQQCASSVHPIVVIERAVSYRERAAGMYSALPFAFGQVVIEIPYIFAQTMIYGLIVYAMIGFEWVAAKLMWYLYIMFFTLSYFTFYGMMTAAMTPNLQIASIISVGAYSLWNIDRTKVNRAFNERSFIVVSMQRTPVWWRWYHWGNPVAWTLYGLVASQYGDARRVSSTNWTEFGVSSRNRFEQKLDGDEPTLVGWWPVEINGVRDVQCRYCGVAVREDSRSEKLEKGF
ncbi:pleiotropic drug resistance 12 [Perilla frutescens var. hirtella]|uniref:Pleiotropic drug resistance 12 n=1 Tax=Perilla frutescens var. hirtella TaxID=608512 RepID=A0AAD4NXR4_PERFH|nr:pleiotropic drug resistance 12 [Perilla frutescens var. hirtella]